MIRIFEEYNENKNEMKHEENNKADDSLPQRLDNHINANKKSQFHGNIDNNLNVRSNNEYQERSGPKLSGLVKGEIVDSSFEKKCVCKSRMFVGASLIEKCAKASREGFVGNNVENKIVWMYKGETGWTPFSEQDNHYIESNRRKGIKVVIIYPYQIDILNLTQTNLLTGRERRILRGNTQLISVKHNRNNEDLVLIESLFNFISVNTSGILKNMFNLLKFDKKSKVNFNGAGEPVRTQKDGRSISICKAVPKLPLENCESSSSTESASTVSSLSSVAPPDGIHGGKLVGKSRPHGKNKTKTKTRICSRVILGDAAGATKGLSGEIVGVELECSSTYGGTLEAGAEKRDETVYLRDKGVPKASFQDLSGSAEFGGQDSPPQVPTPGLSVKLGSFDEPNSSTEKEHSKAHTSGLFFFAPHKYRKRMGIIVPKILTAKQSCKRTAKGSEDKEKDKFVRFNCGMASPDRSKHSLGSYIGTPRRMNSSFSKEERATRKKTNPDFTLENCIEDISSASPTNCSFSPTTQDFDSSPTKSAFIVLDEDVISLDISEYKSSRNFNGYLETLDEWNRFGQIHGGLFETMSENELISRKGMESDFEGFEDDGPASDSNMRVLYDEDTRKIITLRDVDLATGAPIPITWWFNHSVRHITVKLCSESHDIRDSLLFPEIIPLLKPLLTGYLCEKEPIIGRLLPDVQPLGVSSHVLLGLKSLEIFALRPKRSEFPKISEFCFTELNNIIPISLEELRIVQSIVPISVFSLLLTRFPVPAACIFSFSLICNDDELPNTGQQTIQIIDLHLSQTPCVHTKRRNRFVKIKSRKSASSSGDSTCSHVHLDVFREYNRVKICPWLAISNFVDEFVLRTPILVKCIIDPRNIMVVPSVNAGNIKSSKKCLQSAGDAMETVSEASRDAEFVILTANLILPLLIIQSHSIQNIIIGGETNDPTLLSKTATKLRVDSTVFSCRYLPFKFFRVRNLDLFLDLNIDKTELGIFLKNTCKVGTELPSIRTKEDSEYCILQLYNQIDVWIEDFSYWLDKYVCCNSIEILSVNLYVASRYLELKVGNNTSSSGSSHSGECKWCYFEIVDSEIGSSTCASPGSIDVCEDCQLNFESLCRKFSLKCRVNHSSLNDLRIKICVSTILQNLISGALEH
ncbi:WWE domain-containing protein [Cryptosporidium felis]|nr:WWE domain-containing protein [Cryptosporidium felis]